MIDGDFHSLRIKRLINWPLSQSRLNSMSIELAEARKVPLFNSSALTDLIWSPRSRKSIDKIVHILENVPLFNKNDRYLLRGMVIDVDCS